MDTASDQSTDSRVKKPRSRRTKETIKMSQIDSTDARLTTHEAVCAERYAGIEDKMTQIDKRFDKLENDVKELKASTTRSFVEIKELIEQKQSGSQQALITAAGGIIISLIGFLGYLLTHLK